MPRRAQITTIRQNYVDDDDLYQFLTDTFAAGTYKVINLNDGGRRIEAPRKLTTNELTWLQGQKAAREAYQRQRALQECEDY